MEWQAIRDNLGLIVFAAIWLVSFLIRAARRGAASPDAGPSRRRRRSRRRAVVIGLVLMVVAVAGWELSGDLGGKEAAVIRIGALVLFGIALLAMLVAGFSRTGSPVQGEISLEQPGERAAEIRRAEPLEPR